MFGGDETGENNQTAFRDDIVMAPLAKVDAAHLSL